MSSFFFKSTSDFHGIIIVNSILLLSLSPLVLFSIFLFRLVSRICCFFPFAILRQTVKGNSFCILQVLIFHEVVPEIFDVSTSALQAVSCHVAAVLEECCCNCCNSPGVSDDETSNHRTAVTVRDGARRFLGLIPLGASLCQAGQRNEGIVRDVQQSSHNVRVSEYLTCLLSFAEYLEHCFHSFQQLCHHTDILIHLKKNKIK